MDPETRKALKDDIGIMPGDPLAAMMAADDAEHGPEKPRRMAAMLHPEPGTFRFRANVRKMVIRFRLATEIGDPERDVESERKHKNWAARTFGGVKAAEAELKRDKQMLAKLGERQIEFRSLPRLFESTYETRDPEVAAYIRHRIKEPEYAGKVYEEVAPRQVVLESGESVWMIPADDQSRAAIAANYAAGV